MAPSESLSKVLKIGRDRKGNDDLSRTSTANETSSSDRGGARASIDRALDKFKDNIRSTSEDPEPRRSSSDSKTLSRLISKTKRKRRKERISHDDDGPSTVGGPIASSDSQTLDVNANPSAESLGLDQSGGSSLLTEDSDVEG